MQEKVEILRKCPISKSSNRDAYNDICKATGLQCPYYADEGMSVCKSKAKCLSYFAKRFPEVDLKQIVKLIFADTQSMDMPIEEAMNKATQQAEQAGVKETVSHSENSFVEGLEDALKNQAESETEAVEMDESAAEHEILLEKALSAVQIEMEPEEDEMEL